MIDYCFVSLALVLANLNYFQAFVLFQRAVNVCFIGFVVVAFSGWTMVEDNWQNCTRRSWSWSTARRIRPPPSKATDWTESPKPITDVSKIRTLLRPVLRGTSTPSRPRYFVLGPPACEDGSRFLPYSWPAETSTSAEVRSRTVPRGSCGRRPSTTTTATWYTGGTTRNCWKSSSRPLPFSTSCSRVERSSQAYSKSYFPVASFWIIPFRRVSCDYRIAIKVWIGWTMDYSMAGFRCDPTPYS